MLSLVAHPMAPPLMMMDALMADALDIASARAARPRAVPTRLVEHQDGTAYALTLSAPGVKQDDLKVSVTDENVLEVKGETKTSTATHSVRWASRLPRDVDTDAISATVQDGIVSLSLPKKAKAPPLQIALCTTAVATCGRQRPPGAAP